MGTTLTLRTRQAQVFRFSQVAEVLRLSTEELQDHLSAATRDNPALALRRRAPSAGAADFLESYTVADQPSLTAHCQQALGGLIGMGGMVEVLVTTFIEELEPSGWLGASVDEVAQRLSIAPDLVLSALQLVQKRIEPTGLFARGLADCLRLQLEEADQLTEARSRILDHLELLEQGGVAAIAAQVDLSEDEVAHHLKALRGLNPKPGSQFHSDPTLMREPDVIVSEGQSGWQIEFTNPNLEEFVQCKPGLGQGNAALVKARDEARSLKQALRLRQSALEEVVRILVDMQGDYFRQGPVGLSPLTMSEVAERAGFHLSTVSRVLNGLLIEGPTGIVTGKALCPGAVTRTQAHSKPQVQARITQLIGSERASAPLSDGQVQSVLSQEGIVVSRRAVAKYRKELGLPSARRRRAGN